MFAIIGSQRLAVEGNEVASSCHKDTAVKIWKDLTAGIGDKVLAAECGMSAPHYSKVASGLQGDLLDLAYRLPPARIALRREFLTRLAEAENSDPVLSAWEDAQQAINRFLRLAEALVGLRLKPAKATVGGEANERRSA